jgi:hypothetical protein
MWPSSDGPVEHVKTWCANGHCFTLILDTLSPLAPMARLRGVFDTRRRLVGQEMLASNAARDDLGTLMVDALAQGRN